MNQPQQSRGEDEDEDMHEATRDDIKTEEHETPPSSPPPLQHQQTAPLTLSLRNSPSAADILRPLSTFAAQRSFPLPTSGSLASLARGHQHDPADGRRIDRDFESTTSSSSIGSTWMHERLLQSDSSLDATTTTDLEDVGSSATTAAASAAVRDFTTMVWDSSTVAAETTAGTAESTTTATKSKPIHRSVSAYSSSPFSSPGSSLVEGSSGPFEEDGDDQTIFLSPFASIFPDGTNTITPMFIQRYDDDNINDSNDTADADQRTILKYSESIQLFRRTPEDGGKTWKRRVFEYR
ncbi:hypothetical protein ZTR_05143 [Talaromyces verruculosus]|nr:hypothetical protein ZTR_05143 [Talaromyces verruculosus]